MAYNVDSLRTCFADQVSAQLIDADGFSDFDLYLLYDLSVDYVLWPVMVTLCALSAAVSLVNTVVLTRKAMRSYTLNVLLVVLEISNIILAVLVCISSTIEIMFGHFVTTKEVLILQILASNCRFHAAVFINWLTVLIGAWRFIAVNWPLQSVLLLSRKRATAITIIIFVFITFPLGYRGPQYKIENENITICYEMNALNMTSYNIYWFNYQPWVFAYKRTIANLNILANVAYFLMPCVCFMVITGGLLWTIYKNTVYKRTLREGQGGTHAEKGQTRTTIILIVMLSFFLASNSVPSIIRLFNIYPNKKVLLYKLMRIFNPYPLSLLTNSSSLIFYYFMGTNFRNNFHMLFGIYSKAKRPHSASVQTMESEVV